MRRIRFIADVNVEKAVVDYLEGQGYDVRWVAMFDPTLPDENVLDMARQEERVLITNDKDFGKLVFFQRRLTAGTILMRVRTQRSKEKVRALRRLLPEHEAKVTGNFVVVSLDRVRIIRLGESI